MQYLDLDEMDGIGTSRWKAKWFFKQISNRNTTTCQIKPIARIRPLKELDATSTESRALDCSQSWATTLFNIAKICVFIIFLISIALVLIKISTQEGTVVLPFEVSGNENLSGIAIADQLTAELTQIQRIHSIKYEGITLEDE